MECPYPDYPGLNLTNVILEAQRSRIDKNCSERFPRLEAQVVDLADSITYDAHDVDDAVKLDLLSIDDLLELPLIHACFDNVVRLTPELEGQRLRQAIVHELLDRLVGDTLENAAMQLQQLDPQNVDEGRRIRLLASSELEAEKAELETFLYEKVYRHPDLTAVRDRAQSRLRSMFFRFVEEPSLLPLPFQARSRDVGVEVAVGDYLAGMTDSFCHKQYEFLCGQTRAPEDCRPNNR